MRNCDRFLNGKAVKTYLQVLRMSLKWLLCLYTETYGGEDGKAEKICGQVLNGSERYRKTDTNGLTMYGKLYYKS